MYPNDAALAGQHFNPSKACLSRWAPYTKTTILAGTAPEKNTLAPEI